MLGPFSARELILFPFYQIGVKCPTLPLFNPKTVTLISDLKFHVVYIYFQCEIRLSGRRDKENIMSARTY